MNQNITITDIKDTVKVWIEDINYDLDSDIIEQKERSKYLRQSLTLSAILGQLETIGQNNNIR